jgi:hypothetical protein
MGQYPIFTITPVAMFKTRVERSIIDYILFLKGMAKSDSFFIRATTEFNGATFAQTSVDLGAYVDALGKSVLRIHNVAVQWGDALETPNETGTNLHTANAYQLTTQSQTAMVDVTDKSLIASGRLQLHTDGTQAVTVVNDFPDVAPQDWTQGYLVGVEQIYLGVDSNSGNALNLTRCSVVMECTVETLSQSAAMALALSQQ